MPSIERDGLQIHYEEVGSGRPVILLHGFLFSSTMWAGLVDDLKKTNRVITIDFRGHGASSPVDKPFSLYDLVSDVVTVLDECDVERGVWIGLSMGGMVAMRAAVVVPEAVEALVLLDTDSGPESRFQRFRYRAMANGARLIGIKSFVPTVSRMIFGATTHRERPGILGKWEEHLSELRPKSVRNALEAVVRRDPITAMLHEIDVPTLVIVGDEDETLPPARSRTIAEAIDGARLETIPKAGHMTNLERPDLVNPLIREFLRSTSEVPQHPAEDVKAEESAVEPLDRAKEEPAETHAEEAAPGVEAAEPSSQQHGADVSAELGEPEELPEEKTEEAPERTGTESESVMAGVGDELDDYLPIEDDESAEGKELSLPGGKTGRERRGKRRVSPSRKLYGRVGHIGVLLVDVSESGARVEHYDRRFQTGSTITLEIEWEAQTLKAECLVVSCRVHRFIPGDKGATVYQSGLLFRRMNAESAEILKELVARLVTRGLAEQVANARGIGPVLQRDMPTFRSGVVDVAGRSKNAGSEGPVRLIKQNPLTEKIGYIRCRKVGIRWERKWTLDPQQPKEGFTVLASENKLEVDMLCETWDNGDDEAKNFIRDCARMSIEAADRDPVHEE